METAWLWVATLALTASFSALTALIAKEKGHSPLAYGLLGFCVPLVGLIVALTQPDREGERGHGPAHETLRASRARVGEIGLPGAPGEGQRARETRSGVIVGDSEPVVTTGGTAAGGT